MNRKKGSPPAHTEGSRCDLLSAKICQRGPCCHWELCAQMADQPATLIVAIHAAAALTKIHVDHTGRRRTRSLYAELVLRRTYSSTSSTSIFDDVRVLPYGAPKRKKRDAHPFFFFSVLSYEDPTSTGRHFFSYEDRVLRPSSIFVRRSGSSSLVQRTHVARVLSSVVRSASSTVRLTAHACCRH